MKYCLNAFHSEISGSSGADQMEQFTVVKMFYLFTFKNRLNNLEFLRPFRITSRKYWMDYKEEI